MSEKTLHRSSLVWNEEDDPKRVNQQDRNTQHPNDTKSADDALREQELSQRVQCCKVCC